MVRLERYQSCRMVVSKEIFGFKWLLSAERFTGQFKRLGRQPFWLGLISVEMCVTRWLMFKWVLTLAAASFAKTRSPRGT